MYATDFIVGNPNDFPSLKFNNKEIFVNKENENTHDAKENLPIRLPRLQNLVHEHLKNVPIVQGANASQLEHSSNALMKDENVEANFLGL